MIGAILATGAAAVLAGFYVFAGRIFRSPPPIVHVASAAALLTALLAPAVFAALVVAALVVAAIVTLTDRICR